MNDEQGMSNFEGLPTNDLCSIDQFPNQPMMHFPESELILNRDGSIYHLNLNPEDIADTIITVGDPGRVHKVTQYFDDISFEMNKREFITQTGTYNNKRITVVSSGMGTDNVEILLTELDALANIDLKKRVQREKHRRLRILRVGTSGSLQAAIPVDSFVASATAVGLDTLMCYYELPQDAAEQGRAAAIQASLNLPYTPYCASASAEMLRQFGHDMIEGNTITCPGFYAPQGRRLRLPLRIPHLIKEMNYFHEGDYWLTNFEMETAGYYAMCRMLGHDVLSLNAIVANRITHQFSKDPEKTVDTLIKTVLDRI